jgi:hypothetical protein
MRPTVNVRSLLAALLLTLAGAMPSEAAYSFIFNAGPPPGPGGEIGGVDYQGPNDLGGAINVSGPFFGIFGVSTPSNAGKTLPEEGVFFLVFGGSGFFDILGFSGGQFDFVGSVSNANVGPNGGSFLVNGFLSSSAESFFGIPPSTELAGLVTISLSDPELPGGIGNKIGSLQFVFTTAPVPEPASLLATGTGLAIAFGAARAHARARRRRTAA